MCKRVGVGVMGQGFLAFRKTSTYLTGTINPHPRKSQQTFMVLTVNLKQSLKGLLHIRIAKFFNFA